ncbi:S-locus-specific glycoprotein S13-like [Arachis hypogaea]|uniref:S-locus-specific glycoprotein S13-like n=1 Tax=Arachis hypogaea TaxID=3818 RepID=UPI003B219065
MRKLLDLFTALRNNVSCFSICCDGLMYQMLLNTKNPILQLLDSGNLVLREENDENEEKNYLWQSFDYPGDTLLPGIKLGKDLRTGFDRCVMAWKNENDPSPGTLNWRMDVTTWPEPMQRIGTMKQYNNGPWN